MAKSSLAENLKSVVTDSGSKNLTIGSFISKIKDQGFGILLMTLAFPSALPVPAPGYSTPFGILLAVLGLQMIVGRNTPWFPQTILQKKVSRQTARKLVNRSTKLLLLVEKWVHPRPPSCFNTILKRFWGFLVLIMSVLMILPIPLTNTFPAMVIFFLGAALSEKDGKIGIITIVIGVLSVWIYALVLLWGFSMASNLVQYF